MSKAVPPVAARCGRLITRVTAAAMAAGSTLASAFDMKAFGEMWTVAEASVKDMSLDQVKEEIGKQPALFEELLGPCSDNYFREEINMFNAGNLSRGAWLVSLVVCHYAAYRMQLFLYLKASGREELNTMNLWVGIDAPM